MNGGDDLVAGERGSGDRVTDDSVFGDPVTDDSGSGARPRQHDDDRERQPVWSNASPPRPESTHLSPPDPAAAAIVEGALADYDTLSASQVVRRLESLGPDELHAVQRYEASTRNRRTILNRASQLLEERPAAAAGE